MILELITPAIFVTSVGIAVAITYRRQKPQRTGPWIEGDLCKCGNLWERRLGFGPRQVCGSCGARDSREVVIFREVSLTKLYDPRTWDKVRIEYQEKEEEQIEQGEPEPEQEQEQERRLEL